VRIINIAGTRPNFVKIAPLLREMRRQTGITPFLVHTGQHYDDAMSGSFFRDLDIPMPDFNLGVGSGSHATQTAEVMRRLEPILVSSKPDLVLVVGDVNSTVAAALTAVKLGIRVAHVEAGLRSFDRAMPEEINRVVTDAIADLLFVTEESGRHNLLQEGVPADKIHFVGNVMIDALEAFRHRWLDSEVFERLGLNRDRPYAVLTLHRPSNVDDPLTFDRLLAALRALARHLLVVFPVHPRVRARLRLEEGGASAEPGTPATFAEKDIVCVEPLGYLEFVALLSGARLVLTDSGGIQEETTILGVPCLTLRTTTERPVTVTHGTNRIVGTDPQRILAEALSTLERPPKPYGRPSLWDGQTAARIVEVLLARPGAGKRRDTG